MFEIHYDRPMGVLAARLDDLSRSVHARAMYLAAALTRCEWDGDAARAFRHAAGDLLASMRLASTRLESAAAAVRQHGATVQRVADERDRQAARDVRERVDELRDLGTKVVHLVRGDR